jgi:hypothetical protein
MQIELIAFLTMNYPAAELRSIKMNFYLLNPDAEHRGILLIKIVISPGYCKSLQMGAYRVRNSTKKGNLRKASLNNFK